jgi:hypothetical protein
MHAAMPSTKSCTPRRTLDFLTNLARRARVIVAINFFLNVPQSEAAAYSRIARN